MPESQPKIEYAELIKKSLRLAWQNKYLWWFGLFIALTNSGGSFSYSSDRSDWEKIMGGKLGENILNFIASHILLVALLSIALILIFLCLFVFSLICRAGLIQSIEKISRGEKTTFRSGFVSGKKYFWQLFGLIILISFSVFAVIILIILPIITIFLMKSYLLGGILVLVAIAIIVPLIFIASFLRIYGQFYLVLSGTNILSSIEAAYSLFRKNIVSSIIMTLIFLGLNMLAMMVILPPAMIFFVIGFMFFQFFNLIGLIIATLVGIVFFMPVFLVFRSFYETFSQTLWLFFFHEIAKPKADETIAEIAEEKNLAPDANPDPVVYLDK